MQVDRVEAVVHVVAGSLLDHLHGQIDTDQRAIEATQAHPQQPGATTEVQHIELLVGMAGNDLVGDVLGQLVLQAADHVHVVELGHSVEQRAHQFGGLLRRCFAARKLCVVLVDRIIGRQLQ
ncbi:hypothetical protein D3C72_1769470 [compost metagenome]